MRKVFIVIAMLFMVSFANAFEYNWQVARVIDGDTFEVYNEPIAGLGNIKVRLYGIDTPELRGKCEKEKSLASSAKMFADTNLRQVVKVTPIEWDKYGGRVIAKVVVNGKDFSQMMIENGFAVPYFGVGLKKDWCI